MVFNSAMIWLKAELLDVEPVDCAKAPLATDISNKNANMPPTIAVQTFTAPFATCIAEKGDEGLLGFTALEATEREEILRAGIKVQRYGVSISKYLFCDKLPLDIFWIETSRRWLRIVGTRETKRVGNRKSGFARGWRITCRSSAQVTWCVGYEKRGHTLWTGDRRRARKMRALGEDDICCYVVSMGG